MASSAEVEGGWLPRLGIVQLRVLSGEQLFDVVRSMNVTAGRLDGWGWIQLKTLPASWFDGLARILRLVKDESVWPDGLLDACISMIPKVDGGMRLPLGSRLCVCIRWFIECGPLQGWFR